MKKLLVLGILVIAVLVLGDLVARSYAETNIEQAVEAGSTQIGDIEASIRSFPFAGRLLVTGEVPHITLTARDLRGDGTDAIESLRLEIDGLEIDRGVLVDDGKVRVTDVDRVKISAVLDVGFLADLGRAAGLDLVVGNAIELSAQDRTIRANVSVDNGFVTFSAPPLPSVSIPVPSSELIPCSISAQVIDGNFVVACETDELPAIVIAAIGSVELQP